MTVGLAIIRPLPLYPRNHHHFSLPRSLRLATHVGNLQGQLVALHPAKPHPALHGAGRPCA